jgi:hypothetical protein
MYQRGSTKTPFWVAALGGMLFVFASYLLYAGFLTFLTSGGDITAPATATAASAAQATGYALNQAPEVGAQGTARIPTRLPTRTTVPPCQDFVVSVVKARVRECAKDTCTSLDTMLSQGQIVCVLGPAAGAVDWYQVNLRPDQLYPEIAYMHSSVIDAVRPTSRPSRTPTGLPTVTPLPTITNTPTPTALSVAIPKKATASAPSP